MTSKRVAKDVLGEFEDLQTQRQTWNVLWQEVAKYMHGSELNFTEKYIEGQDLTKDRYENSGIYASTTLASSLVGILWGSGGKSVKLVPALGVSESEENKEFFEKITAVLSDNLDNPDAGLEVALATFMLDQVTFGTGGLAIFEGDEGGLRYEPWSITNLYIAENQHGKIETTYRLHKLTLRRIISTYGIDNLSDHLRGLAEKDSNLSDKFEILHCIKKREEYDPAMKGALDMPYMSIHMEKETCHIIKESGFLEHPVKIGRFKKLSFEEYGRSPGIDALADTRELEFLRRRFSTAIDKISNPPLIIQNDGRLGGATVDTSAGSMIVIDVSTGRFNSALDPIRPLNTVGDLQGVLVRIEQLKQNISQFFFLDKLIDFNGGGPQMTATEVLLRDLIKKYSIGSVLARQTADVFSPMVARSFNILFKQGMLGVVQGSEEEEMLLQKGIEPIYIPEEIQDRINKGLSIYDIHYDTPSSQTVRSQEAEKLNNLVQFKLGMQAGSPEVEDVFNADEALKLASDIAGLPKMVRSEEETAMIRQQRQQQEQQQMAVDQAEQGARAGRDAEQAGLI